MLFNSLSFAFFFPIVFILYWYLNKKNNLIFQNLFLLVASYFFYACWNLSFMFLLIFSTLLDYYTGIKIHDESNIRKKKIWLWVSIGINLGFLGIFKYYNFFAISFAELLSHFGIKLDLWTLNVILPVGISFYTFHGLSYVIDIYKKKINPERNFINYSVFVSFFPLLVAGPIERATHLLPQILKKRSFNYKNAVNGLRQILWGLFKKIVIADNCAEFANKIFNNYTEYSGSTLVLGAIYFAFQIYCDFSGYSDIALGIARLLGFDLLKNFSFPYFSRDIAEFWRRWHISLSSWFKDYIYIPMGGSRGSLKRKLLNIFVIFIISGFWHGANWTFIVWGALNALYFLPLFILKKNRINTNIIAQGNYLPSIKETIQMIITFSLSVFAWIFFRAENITHAFNYIKKIFSHSLFIFPDLFGVRNYISLILLGIFLIIEWIGREQNYAIESFALKWKKIYRYLFYYFLILIIIFMGGKDQNFIYFQF